MEWEATSPIRLIIDLWIYFKKINDAPISDVIEYIQMGYIRSMSIQFNECYEQYKNLLSYTLTLKEGVKN